MISGNIVLFVGVWWIWQKKVETQRGSIIAFLFFMATFSLFIASAVLAALGNAFCRVTFSLACISDVPLIFLVWLFLRKHLESCERLEFKASSKRENARQGKRKS